MLDILVGFSLLASGSDDQHAIIWDPFKHKKLTTMHTGHAANIFSVKVSWTVLSQEGSDLNILYFVSVNID